MAIEYVALYANWFGWEKGEDPVGIVVDERVYAPDMESLEYHSMHWSHIQQGWVYDPQGDAQLLAELDEDTFREIGRDEAERVTPGITGREGLPDEDTIRWIFQWKGAPPQAEDTGY